MSFWGIEVKPGKPYQYQFDDVPGKLHVTQATLGDGSSTERSTVQCCNGDENPVRLCSLLPNKNETCPMNLEFDSNDEESVSFSVTGPRSVHLSGFFKVNDRVSIDDEFYESYSDSDEEDIADTENEDDSSDYDVEDEFHQDFMKLGDYKVFPPSPVPKSGVVIEEIMDEDEKLANATSQAIPALKNVEEEDEDGFPIASKNNSKPNSEKAKPDAKEKAERKSNKETKKKRRRDDSDQHEKVANQPLDSEKDNKKNKKKKQKQSTEKENEHGGTDELNKPMNLEGSAPEGKDKKKKKKSNNTQETNGDAQKGKTDKPMGDTNGVTVTPEEKKDNTKQSKVRTFPDGLVIEQLAMGKPNGKRASRGNKVSIRYIGKLKKNGKIFDSNVGRAPFKFCLGAGEVIKGWEVGVNGMRVGDKRKLTIPPSLGYGAKGAGKDIPPNSWLEFDVELVNVR